MKFGVDVPTHGRYADPQLLLEMALDAEEAGWDGFFLWDHIALAGKAPQVTDPWIVLAAIAANTHCIRLGTMVTPLARRRPWKLAREAVALDHLSNGRVTLGVGLGAVGKTEFAAFGEESDAAVRAEKLDEALALLAAFWSGEKVFFQGRHFQVDGALFQPVPKQQPRIPIWVGGYWPHKAPMRRAARWDGVFPLQSGLGAKRMMAPDVVREVVAYVQSQRTDETAIDVVHWGLSSVKREDDLRVVQAYAEAAVTWWLENINPGRGSIRQMRERIRSGPPRV
jgi:alkanesulfonate monooxygenase SsuD/methylene tetrahydromethanopterin reductase-like flavin-dependent oxidoreductase (luciferase family)